MKTTREARSAAKLGRGGHRMTRQSVEQLSVGAAPLAPTADAQTQQMTGLDDKSPSDRLGRQSSARPASTRTTMHGAPRSDPAMPVVGAPQSEGRISQA